LSVQIGTLVQVGQAGSLLMKLLLIHLAFSLSVLFS